MNGIIFSWLSVCGVSFYLDLVEWSRVDPLILFQD